MERAVGYCTNDGCEDFAKGVFLLKQTSAFRCPGCLDEGMFVKETGEARIVGDAPYKEVRVEFNYDPGDGRYCEIAVLRDESIPDPGSSYLLKSPLIKTDKRALKVAEQMLAHLQRDDVVADGEIPRACEMVISLDASLKDFRENLKNMSITWQHSSLAQPASPIKKAKAKARAKGKNLARAHG